MNYESQFHNALIFSEQFGLDVPNWDGVCEKIVTPSMEQNLANLMTRILGTPPRLDNLSGQCMQVHWSHMKEIKQIVGADACLTIGSVISDDGDEWFTVSEDDVSGWVANGIDFTIPQKLHAWLTLPSMEIIDITFLPTFAHAQHIKDPAKRNLEFGPIAKYADDVTGFSYVPIALGNDMATKLKIPTLNLIVI